MSTRCACVCICSYKFQPSPSARAHFPSDPMSVSSSRAHLIKRLLSSAVSLPSSLNTTSRSVRNFASTKRAMSTGKDGPGVSSVSSVGFRLSRSGRFSGETDPLMEQFNASFPYDKRMWRQDLHGSIAYAAALGRCGLLKKEEVEVLQNGLKEVEKEWEAGKFEAKPGDEDIHTANERRLTELVGSVGGKLHTGRSRNDQVRIGVRAKNTLHTSTSLHDNATANT